MGIGIGWSTAGAAFIGCCLGALGVMAHEVYDGVSGRCPTGEPFTHIMAELAMFVPGGALSCAGLAHIRNRFLRTESAPVAGDPRSS